MKTVGDRIEAFSVPAARPGFNHAEENGESAFEIVTEQSFHGFWKILYFYPRDFSWVCPSEIIGFSRLVEAFAARDAIVLGGSVDNEYVKLAWRRENPELASLNHYSFGDTKGDLVDQLGIRDKESGVALRATFIIDPGNVIQHVAVNNLAVGRHPEETLRVLDALQTGELCRADRPIGG
jgi:peroxiredoxin (alkyl hydroperoxide reductase subunit C)